MRAIIFAIGLATQAAPAFGQSAAALRDQAQALNGQGQWEPARAKLEAAIAAYKAEGKDPEGLSVVLGTLARNRSAVKDYAAAAQAAREELAIVRTLTGDRDNDSHEEDLAATLSSLAFFLRGAGDYVAAQAPQAEAVAVNRKRDAMPTERDDQGTPDLAESLERRGEIAFGLGDKAGAIAAFEEALPIRRKIAETRPAQVHSSTLAELLEYLFLATGEQKYRDESRAILATLPKYYGTGSDTWLRDLPGLGAFKR